MKISVIIAVYNEDQHLSKCLKSLAMQQRVSYEVLVIDDGSSQTIKARKFGLNEDKHFCFYRINHSGTAIARNFGAKKAKGDILVFLDGDMEFESDFLELLISPIEQNLGKGTLSTEEWVANWDNVWARCWNFEHGLMSKKRINEKDMNLRDFRAILKSEFERVGGFDNTGYTDTWTLSEKLGYLPVKTKAKYYHYNPSTLSEILKQAMWIGGRKRKLGILGRIIAGLRSSFFCSFIYGIIGSFRFHQFHYFIFKIVYDLGIFIGNISGSKIKP